MKRASLSLQQLALRRLSSFTAFTLRGHIDQVLDLRSTQELAAFAAIVSTFSLSNETRRFARRSGLRPRLLVKTPAELRWRILSDLQKWRTQPQMFGIPASSQIFGRLVRDAGFEAILYPSQRAAGMNLAVFVENFRDSSSRIEVVGGAPAGADVLDARQGQPQESGMVALPVRGLPGHMWTPPSGQAIATKGTELGHIFGVVVQR